MSKSQKPKLVIPKYEPPTLDAKVVSSIEDMKAKAPMLTAQTQRTKNVNESYSLEEQKARDTKQAEKQAKMKALAEKKAMMYGSSELDKIFNEVDKGATNIVDGKVQVDVDKLTKQQEILDMNIADLQMKSGLGRMGQKTPVANAVKFEDDDSELTTFVKGIGKFVAPAADKLYNIIDNHLINPKDDDYVAGFRSPDYKNKMYEYQIQQLQAYKNAVAVKKEYAKQNAIKMQNGVADVDVAGDWKSGLRSTVNAAAKGYIGNFTDVVTYGGATPIINALTGVSSTEGRELLLQDLMAKKTESGTQADMTIPSIGTNFKDYQAGWGNVFADTGYGLVNLFSSLAGGSFSQTGKAAGKTIGLAEKGVKIGQEALERNKLLRMTAEYADDAAWISGAKSTMAKKAMDKEWLKTTKFFSDDVKSQLMKVRTPQKAEKIVEKAMQIEGKTALKDLIYERVKAASQIADQKVFTDIAPEILEKVPGGQGLKTMNRIQQIMDDMYRNDLSINGTAIANAGNPLHELAFTGARMYLTGLYNSGDPENAEHLAMLGAISAGMSHLFKTAGRAYGLRNETLRKSLEYGDKKLTEDLILKNQHTQAILSGIGGDIGGAVVQTGVDLVSAMSDPDVKKNVLKEFFKIFIPNIVFAHNAKNEANEYAKALELDIAKLNKSIRTRTEFNEIANHTPDAKYADIVTGKIAEKEVTGQINKQRKESYYELEPDQRTMTYETVIKNAGDKYGTIKDVTNVTAGELIATFDKLQEKGLLPAEYDNMKKAGSSEILKDLPPDTKVVFSNEATNESGSTAEYNADTQTITFYNKDLSKLAKAEPEHIFANTAAAIHEETIHAATIAKIKAKPEIVEAERQKVAEMYKKYQEEGGVDETGAYLRFIPGVDYALSSNEEFLANMFQGNQTKMFEFINEQTKGKLPKFVDTMLKTVGIKGDEAQAIRKKLAKSMKDVLPDTANEIYTQPIEQPNINLSDLEARSEEIKQKTTNLSTDPKEFVTDVLNKIKDQGIDVGLEDLLPENLLEYNKIKEERTDEIFNYGLHPDLFAGTEKNVDEISDMVVQWNETMPLKITNADAYNIAKTMTGKGTGEITVDEVKAVLSAMKGNLDESSQDILDEMRAFNDNQRTQKEILAYEKSQNEDLEGLDKRAYTALGFGNSREMYAAYSSYNHPGKTKAELSKLAYADIVKAMTDNIAKKEGTVSKEKQKEIELIAFREAVKLANTTMKPDVKTGEMVPFPNMISFENGKEFIKSKIAPNLTLDNKAMLTYVVDKLLDLKPDNSGSKVKEYGQYWASEIESKVFNYHIIPDVNNMVIDLSTDSAGKEITPARKANMLIKLHHVLVNHALTSEAMYKGSKDPSLVTKAAKELMPFMNYRALAEGKTNPDEIFTYKTVGQEYNVKSDNESFFKAKMSQHAEHIKDIVDVASQLYKNKGVNPYKIADGINEEVNRMPLQKAFDSAFHGVLNLALNHGNNDITPKTSYLDSNGRLVVDQGKLSAKYGKLFVDNNTLKLTDVGMLELINPALVSEGKVNKEVLSQYPDLVLTDTGDLAVRSVNVEPLLKYFEGDVANWFNGVMSKNSKRVDGGMVGIGKLPGLDMLAKIAKGKDNWKYLKTKGTNENQGIFKNAIHRYDEGQMVHTSTPGYNDIKQVIEKVAARGVLLQDGTSIKNADQMYEYKKVPLTFMDGNFTALVNNDGSIAKVVDATGKVDKDAMETAMRILAKEFLNTGTLPKEFTAEQPITGKHAMTIMGADKPADHNAGALAAFKLLGLVPTGRSTFKPAKETIANYVKAMSEITDANREYFGKQLQGLNAMRGMFKQLSQGEHIAGTKEELTALDSTLRGFTEMLSENPELLWYGKTGESLIAEIDNLYNIDENNVRTDLNKDKTERFLIDNYKLFTGKKKTTTNDSANITHESREQSLLYSLAQRNYNKILNGETLNGSNSLIVNPNFSDARFNIEEFVGKDTALARHLTEQFIDPNTGNIINGGITLPKDFVNSKNLKPGMKLLVARKPSHGPDSVAVMTLIGVTDSNQGVMGDNTIFADSMGMDYDKDSVAITLPDPHILTQDRYDAMVQYVGDLTSDNVGLLPNVRKMDANGELAEHFNARGWDISQSQSHNPLSDEAHYKAVRATSGAGNGVALKNNIAMLLANYSKNTFVDKATGQRKLVVKVGNTELKMHFPIDLDLDTALSTDAAQLGYDGWGDYNYDPQLGILLPFFESYTYPNKKGDDTYTITAKDIVANPDSMLGVVKAIKELSGSNAFDSVTEKGELAPRTTEYYNTPGSNAARVLGEYDIANFARNLDALDEELGFLDYTEQVKNKAKEGTKQLRTELWNSGLIGREGPGGFIVRKFYKTLDKKPYNDYAEVPGLVRHDETLNGIRDAILRNVSNFGAVTQNGSKAIHLSSAIQKHPNLVVAAARRLNVGSKFTMAGAEVEIIGNNNVLVNKETVPFEKFLIDYASSATPQDNAALEQLYQDQKTFKQDDATYYKAQTTLDGIIAAVPILAKKNNIDISNFAQKGDLRAGNAKDDIMTATIKEIALATFMGEPTKEALGTNNLWVGKDKGSTIKANMRALEVAGIEPRIGDKRLEELAIEEFQTKLKETQQEEVSPRNNTPIDTSNFKIPVSPALTEFISEKSDTAYDEEALYKKFQELPIQDKEIIAKSLNIQDVSRLEFDDINSDVAQEDIMYYLRTGKNLDADVIDTVRNSELVKQYDQFVTENKPIVDGYKKASPEIRKELEKDIEKLKTKDQWFQREIDLLRFNTREQLQQEPPKSNTFDNVPVSKRKYQGGFSDVGKGTPLGDSKDQAMRLAAQAAIVEIGKDSPSSSLTTWQSYKDQRKHGKTHWSEHDENKLPNTVMLARNGVLKGKPLTNATKELIKDYANQGVKFVVGDMPGVDSQFIDYLDEIGADYTIYHAGDTPRIKPKSNTFGNAPNLYAGEDVVDTGIFDKVKTSNKMLLKAMEAKESTKHLANKDIVNWTKEDFDLAKPIIKEQMKTKLRQLEKTINPPLWKRLTGGFSSSKLGTKWTDKTTERVEKELSKMLDGFNYLEQVGHKAGLQGGMDPVRISMAKAMLIPTMVTKANELMKAKGYTEVDNYLGTLNIFDQLKYGSHNPKVLHANEVTNAFKKEYKAGQAPIPVPLKAGQQYFDKRLGMIGTYVNTTEQQYRLIDDHLQMALAKDQVGNILRKYYNPLDGNSAVDYNIETALPLLQKLVSNPEVKAIFDKYIVPEYSVSHENMQVIGKINGTHVDYANPSEIQTIKNTALNHLVPQITAKILGHAQSSVLDEALQNALPDINETNVRAALSLYADHVILNGAMAKGMQLITDNIENLASKNSLFADTKSYEMVRQELLTQIADFEDIQQAGRWTQSQEMNKEFLQNAVALTEYVKQNVDGELAQKLFKTMGIKIATKVSEDPGITALDLLTKALDKFTSSEKSSSQVAKLFKDVDLPKEQEIRLTKANIVVLADALGIDMPQTSLMNTKELPDRIAGSLNHILGTLGAISKDIFNSTIKDSEYSRSITNTILSEYSGKEFTDNTIIKNDANPDRLKQIFDDPSKDLPKGQMLEFIHQFNDKLNVKRGRYLGIVPRKVTIVENGTETTVEKQLIAIHTMNGLKSNIELIDEADIKSMTAQEKVSRGGAKAEARIRKAYQDGSNELLMQVQNYASEAKYEKTDKGTYDAVQTANKIYSDKAAVTKLYTDGRMLAKISKEEYSKADAIASHLGRFSTAIAYSTFGKAGLEAVTGISGMILSPVLPGLIAPSLTLLGKSVATGLKRISKLELDAIFGGMHSYAMDSTQSDRRLYEGMSYYERMTSRLNALRKARMPQATARSTALEAQSQASLTGAIDESGATDKSWNDMQQARKNLELYKKVDNFIAEGFGKPITDLQVQGKEAYTKLVESQGENVEFVPIGKRGYSLRINGRDYSQIQDAAKSLADQIVNLMHATEFQAELEGKTVEKATANATKILEENRIAMENMLGTSLDRDQAMTLAYVDYSVKKAIGSFQKSAKQATPFGKLLTQFSRYSREAAVDQFNLYKYRGPIFEAVKDTITETAKNAPNDPTAAKTLAALTQLGIVGENSIMGPVDRLKKRVIGMNTATFFQTASMLTLSQLLLGTVNQLLDDDIEDENAKAFTKGIKSIVPQASSDTMRPFSFIGQGGQVGSMIAYALNGLAGMGMLVNDLTTDDKIDGRSLAKHTDDLSNMSRATALGGSMTLGVIADMAAIGLFSAIYAMTEKGSGFEDYEARNPNYFLRFASKQLGENANFHPAAYPLGYYLQELINIHTQAEKKGEPVSYGIIDLMKPKETIPPVQDEPVEVEKTREQIMQEREQRMEQRMQEAEKRMEQRQAEIDERLRNRNN